MPLNEREAPWGMGAKYAPGVISVHHFNTGIDLLLRWSEDDHAWMPVDLNDASLVIFRPRLWYYGLIYWLVTVAVLIVLAVVWRWGA
jgi:hypothetical protein